MVKPILGILTNDRSVLEPCWPVLAELGEPQVVATQEGSLAVPLTLHALLLDLGEDRDEGVGHFAECLRANPAVPVLLLGQEVPGDLAAELIKLGATDFVALPIDARVLRRKLLRVLNGGREPTVWLGTLDPLRPKKQPEQRRAHRVAVPPDSGARARLMHGRGYVAADLVDLSLESEGWPGGMLMRVLRGSPTSAALEAAGKGTKLVFQILLPTVAAPLLMAGQVLRTRPHRDDSYFQLVLQYRPANAEADSRLNRFWMDCQMRERQAERAA